MPQRRLILLSEIDRQCRFALEGYDEAMNAMAARNAERFWHSLEAILAAAGQLHGLTAAAGLPLADDSPLRAPELAHVAEVDSWQPRRSEITPSNFGPDGFTRAHPGECARFFDLDTSIFILFGHIFEMPPLLAEIAELEHRAEAEIEYAALK